MSFYSSLKKMIHWLHSIFFEILALIVTFFLRPIGYFFPQKNATGKKNAPALLLIHGYLHDSSAWLFFKNALKKKYPGPIYTLNLLRPFHSIEDHAQLIAKKAEEIMKETGLDQIKLLGHSMGGLVAATYLTEYASCPEKVHLITLGSPLQGTYLAYIALGKNGQEMRPNSLFLQKLNEQLKKSNSQIDHIGSMTDQIIVPQNSAFTTISSARKLEIQNLGHMSLLFSPKVVDQVAIWLNES